MDDESSLPTLTLVMPLKELNETHDFILLRNIFFFFGLFRAAPAAYRGSQVRGPMRAVAAGLHHSHSNSGSKLSLQPTPQLMATLDP